VGVVTEEDRAVWDERYERVGPAPLAAAGDPPPLLTPYEHEFPLAGHALDIACGRGSVAVWLARRGLKVCGLDISSVAIDLADDLAQRAGVGDRCRFSVLDLDDGLPDGPPVDVIMCNRFRDPRLDGELIRRLAPGGLLAITALSEVDAGPGRFRVPPGELLAAFAELHLIAAGEGDGEAWLLARA
jgi:2-polyprenyl-3-methyl-5-hydroxy-6-metoxy-1,4-benzoquinol methylase